jgi:2-iminobutanoate/2-iminopropanoate deaminase
LTARETAAPVEGERRAVHSDSAPRAIGPYSQAIVASGLVFCSGQIGLDPATGQLAGGDVKSETRRVLENLAAVLQAAGSSLDKVVRCTVYLEDLNDFQAMNEEYAAFFKNPAPARATVEVSRLPKDARVEIDAIALL